MRRLPALAIALALLVTAVRAEAIEFELSSSRGLGRNMDVARYGLTSDAKFPGPVQFLGARGEAHAFERLGVFAAGKGFRLGDLDAAYDVEGGASILLRHGVELTGAYRLLGLGLMGARVPDLDDSTPVLGLHLSF
jgi:hypothetical protein